MPSKLSIITVVHQNLEGLKLLFNTLEPILSRDIEWVIKDSAKCEITREWGEKISNPFVKFISHPDTGIYSALNTAILNSTGEYYLTVGSDDVIYAANIEKFVDSLSDFQQKGIHIFPVIINGKVLNRKRWRPLFISTSGYIVSHSVGTVIAKELHSSIGFYDESYSILADSLFISKCIKNRVKFYYHKEQTLGEFGLQGISSTRKYLMMTEAYRYQKALGSNTIVQGLLFFSRFLKTTLGRVARLGR